ncbi:MAG: glycoside hydrolase [Cytophagales bacterium]|nr:glycoside hydrolase [Cytophagales bacterium]
MKTILKSTLNLFLLSSFLFSCSESVKIDESPKSRSEELPAEVQNILNKNPILKAKISGLGKIDIISTNAYLTTKDNFESIQNIPTTNAKEFFGPASSSSHGCLHSDIRGFDQTICIDNEKVITYYASPPRTMTHIGIKPDSYLSINYSDADGNIKSDSFKKNANYQPGDWDISSQDNTIGVFTHFEFESQNLWVMSRRDHALLALEKYNGNELLQKGLIYGFDFGVFSLDDPQNINAVVLWEKNKETKDSDKIHHSPRTAYFIRSSDGGKTWSSPILLTESNKSWLAYTTIHRLAPKHLVLRNPHIFGNGLESRDNGQSWQIIELPHFRQLSQLLTGSLCTARPGTTSSIYALSLCDYSEQRIIRNIFLPAEFDESSRDLVQFDFLNKDVGICYNEKLLLQTKDGGYSWEKIIERITE